MRATLLKLHNVAAFEDAEIKLGDITVVKGENGSGKTVVITAFRNLFARTCEEGLLRIGADEGEIVLVLDDGTEISRKLTPEGAKPPVVRDPKQGRLNRYRSFLDQLADLFAINPVVLLNAAIPIKERIDWLKDILAPELDKDELRRAVGRPLTDNQLEGPAFDVVASVRKQIYEERTTVNADGRAARDAAQRLSEALPEDDGTDWDADASTLREQQTNLAAKVEQIKGAIRTETLIKVDAARAEYDKQVEAIKAEADRLLQEATSEHVEQQRTLDGRIAEVQAKRDQEERAKVIRAEKERNAKTATAAKLLSTKLSKALNSTDELKAEMLKALPIPGLEIRDNQIYLGDVVFDRVNTARKVSVALQAGALKGKKLGPDGLKMMCLDDAEHLDSETYAKLEQGAHKLAEHGYQFIVTKVTDPPKGWPEGKRYLETEVR